MKSLMLFLGSGVSSASGAPTVGAITQSLFSDGWSADNAERYVPGQDEDGTVARLKKYLAILQTHADDYFGRRLGRESTYEDLFYLAELIENVTSHETDDAALAPFMDTITEKTAHLCDQEFPLETLTRKAARFIQWVVYHKLKGCQLPKGLDAIRDLARSNELDRLDIVTLNHDVLVERLLDTEGIPYNDGFMPDNRLMRFTPPQFDRAPVKIRLFKLHGSIDWWWDGQLRMDSKHRCIKVPISESEESLTDRNSFIRRRYGPQPPVILTGTLNKGRQYSHGVHEVLFYDWFRLLLCKYCMIVMSGYGGWDSQISLRFRNWLLKDKERKLVLLYENPNASIHGFLRYVENPWSREILLPNQIILLNKWLADTSACELTPFAEDINWAG
jgi:hypothetical protein